MWLFRLKISLAPVHAAMEVEDADSPWDAREREIIMEIDKYAQHSERIQRGRLRQMLFVLFFHGETKWNSCSSIDRRKRANGDSRIVFLNDEHVAGQEHILNQKISRLTATVQTNWFVGVGGDCEI